MRDADAPTQVLILKWFPVISPDGRVRMEGRWVLEDANAHHPVVAA